MSRQVLRMTTVDLTARFKERGTEEESFKLELLYRELEEFAKAATDAQRKAAQAQALAKIEDGKRELKAIEFLQFASIYSELIATEHNWMLPRRNAEGQIVIDNPLTRKDVLAAAKASHRQLAQQVEDDDLDLFEGDEGNT